MIWKTRRRLEGQHWKETGRTTLEGDWKDNTGRRLEGDWKDNTGGRLGETGRIKWKDKTRRRILVFMIITRLRA